MIRFLIFGPIFLFLAACFLSIASALGVNIATVTDILMVVAGIFAGALIFFCCFGRQWRPGDADSQSGSRELTGGDTAPAVSTGAKGEPQEEGGQGRAASPPEVALSDEGRAAVTNERPLSLAAPSGPMTPPSSLLPPPAEET